MYRMSQEELLEEAKITEAENLKSLEKYKLAELDRKKPKIARRGISGPFIKYHSTAMPIIKKQQTIMLRKNLLLKIQKTIYLEKLKCPF